jgi:hypothetical protein
MQIGPLSTPERVSCPGRSLDAVIYIQRRSAYHPDLPLFSENFSIYQERSHSQDLAKMADGKDVRHLNINQSWRTRKGTCLKA